MYFEVTSLLGLGVFKPVKCAPPVPTTICLMPRDLSSALPGVWGANRS